MQDLSPYIEYNLLEQDTNWAKIQRICGVAKSKNFAALCIPPWLIKKTKAALAGSKVKVCSVAAYPLGLGLMLTKWTETLQIFGEGADEVGVSLNLSAIKSGDIDHFRNEVAGLGVQSRERGTVLKLIVETEQLDFAELDIICGFLLQAAPAFVETSSEMTNFGLELDKVAHIRAMLPSTIQLKTSSRNLSYEAALKLIEAGADRIGTTTIWTQS